MVCFVFVFFTEKCCLCAQQVETLLSCLALLLLFNDAGFYDGPWACSGQVLVLVRVSFDGRAVKVRLWTHPVVPTRFSQWRNNKKKEKSVKFCLTFLGKLAARSILLLYLNIIKTKIWLYHILKQSCVSLFNVKHFATNSGNFLWDRMTSQLQRILVKCLKINLCDFYNSFDCELCFCLDKFLCRFCLEFILKSV